jgi:hypothetical protein
MLNYIIYSTLYEGEGFFLVKNGGVLIMLNILLCGDGRVEYT